MNLDCWMNYHFGSLQRNEKLASITRIFIENWAAARYSAANSILQLTRVSAAGYELRLILSCGWLEFRRLDTSCGWFYPAADLSSGGWIRVVADSVPRLTWVPVAGYNLRLIPSCGWLWVAGDLNSGGSIQVTVDSILRVTTSCSWFYHAADSSSAGWTRLVGDLCFNVSNKFKDLFCKIHHFYSWFSIAWFQLPLIKALAVASRTLKKLEEA